jgi:DNA primase
VLVEDLVSAHKVRQVTACLPLFGTTLYPKTVQALRALKRPVVLWLDSDQYTLLPPKINRLQAFLDVPVRFVKTEKDPKAYSLEEIRATLQTT